MNFLFVGDEIPTHMVVQDVDVLVPHSWIFCDPGCLGGNEDPSTLVSDSRFLQASGHPFALKEAFFLPGIFQAFKLLGMVGLGRWELLFNCFFFLKSEQKVH